MTDLSAGSSPAGPRPADGPPPDRYGSPLRGRRAVVAVAAVIALAFLGWLAWSTWSFSSPSVTSEMVGWESAGPHAVTARVDVHLDEGVRATCTLRAYAEDHSTVGERVFAVPGPDDSGTGTTELTLRTERAATAVELVGCTAPGQNRPR